MAPAKWIVEQSMQQAKLVLLSVLFLVAIAAWQIPAISIDTDPENMLPHDQAERVFHDQVKQRFSLNDMLVVGIVNQTNPHGIYNPQTLKVLERLAQSIRPMEGVIEQDLMDLSSVDNISQVEGQPGTIRFQWLMQSAPEHQAGAEFIREAVERLPLLHNTLVSADAQAAAIYIPISAKSESYRLSQEIQGVIDQLKNEYGEENHFYMAGLPVAEDTFGVEMFIQMAISAPLAGLMIFALMWLFFRSLLLITAPMLVAMAAVIMTMGLLIGQGFTVHIMSSMIPIFLMPIAVVDSVHILSEFADRYKPGDKPQQALRQVLGHLFSPMLYTSVTSAVGFASLAFTPIPPVQVFGLHVAFGILLAFLLTVTLVPAFIVSLSPQRLALLKDHSLTDDAANTAQSPGRMGLLLAAIGRLSVGRAKLLILLFTLLSVVSVYGLSQIQINDNPVRWFKQDHRLRVADEVMNRHFPGTYDAYLVLEKTTGEEADKALLRKLTEVAAGADLNEALKSLLPAFELPLRASDLDRLARTLDDAAFDDAQRQDQWLQLLDLVEAEQRQRSYFISPEGLNYLQGLQTFLDQSALVGKSNSLVTLLKTIYRELQGGAAEQYRLPPTQAAAAQSLLSYQSSHRPDDLWHLVTPDYNATLLWLQLNSGDNQDMVRVVELVQSYIDQHPLPAGVELNWAGLTYINLVWQEEMVNGMLKSLISAFFMVLLMMLLLFRSIPLGLLAMLPLSVTILFIYGLIGFVGKDYDMPIAVLSALTLGLSVDFAIHFLERCRAIYRATGSWPATLNELYQGPARAISRNAIVVAIGFTPLLFAPLVPYITVGFFLAMIMLVSAAVTLILLPAAIGLIGNKTGLFSAAKQEQKND